MEYLTVLYGSEASVLRGYEPRSNETFLKIFNRTEPTPSENSLCCQLLSFEKTLEEILTARDISGLRFIGAGFIEQSKLFIAEDEGSISSQLTANIENYLYISKVMLPHMIRRKYGRFVYLSSIRAEIGGIGTSIYSASKAFGERYFSTIGQEYGKVGISSVSIRMGFFDGKMIEEYSSEKRNNVISSISNKQLGSQADLQNTINFCFENPYLNGGTIDLNGGLTYG